ncbi:metalloregulator ArsR/SmtB family transcription factor [Pelagicoccus sp. SDUM812002]|uniref:metalloregulator ArsR/SmtB family transcription factor n=1 Tax=Pelagicoccus sp. SDUM812002 TaxID=3041266 RepID=UPI00280C4C2E|nr:metalloregulator ArsR/SmtB family transcription factor [Pelagicoccus sp. SDUM812002]MDQ8187988.1 metalloregulator ArsR/SmtB family transcription factor [Pelagicoccus sp. SDUM812002]
MKPAWDTLKTLADPTRLRILNLLSRDELSVAELQDALGMAQSRISSQLAVLRQSDLVADRREGKKSFYSLSPNIPSPESTLLKAALSAAEDSAEIKEDTANLDHVIAKRRRQAEEYFNLIAGRLGKNYCPGRSWEGIGHFLLYLVPHIRVVDLGAGEGLISQLLARHAERVYCVDSSPRMVEVGTELAKRNKLDNLEYIHGDIEETSLPDQSVHLALLSQALHHALHPERAISEAFRLLKPGGRLVILDLKEHNFEKAHELYADRWLGFSENKLHNWLKEAGFENVEVTAVAKEEFEPQFETLLASGVRPQE